MGMKREALRLARQKLKSLAITGEDFNGSLNAILTQADNFKPWTALIESAYARLPVGDRRSVRSLTLAFHCGNRDYERARRFIPGRFDGCFGPLELAFTMETMLALGNMAEAKRLARKFPGAIRDAENPVMRSSLMDQLAEYLAKTGEWEKAIKIWDIVQLDETYMENGVTGIVEIHAARALRAVRFGFQLIAQFKKNFDPELETTLPGNERKRWARTEKQLRRFEKMLERILPEKRRKELEVDTNA